jgi:hypothetical protein
MSFSSDFGSKWLTASDLPDGQHLHAVINSCRKRPVGMDQTQKWVVDFVDGVGTPILKPLILNTRNGRVLAEAYGDSPAGQPVELYKEPTMTPSGASTMGVRLAIPPAVDDLGDEAKPAGNGRTDALPEDEVPW